MDIFKRVTYSSYPMYLICMIVATPIGGVVIIICSLLEALLESAKLFVVVFVSGLHDLNVELDVTRKEFKKKQEKYHEERKSNNT